jgi:hypothetical protein
MFNIIILVEGAVHFSPTVYPVKLGLKLSQIYDARDISVLQTLMNHIQRLPMKSLAAIFL